MVLGPAYKSCSGNVLRVVASGTAVPSALHPPLTKHLCFPFNTTVLHKKAHEHRAEPGVRSSRASVLIMSYSDVFY